VNEQENDAAASNIFPAKDGVQRFYSNYVEASWTIHDLKVRFCQVIPHPHPSESKVWAAEEQAAVILPWSMAKGVLLQLTKLVEAYEKANGAIRPPNLARLQD